MSVPLTPLERVAAAVMIGAALFVVVMLLTGCSQTIYLCPDARTALDPYGPGTPPVVTPR